MLQRASGRKQEQYNIYLHYNMLAAKVITRSSTITPTTPAADNSDLSCETEEDDRVDADSAACVEAITTTSLFESEKRRRVQPQQSLQRLALKSCEKNNFEHTSIKGRLKYAEEETGQLRENVLEVGDCETTHNYCNDNISGDMNSTSTIPLVTSISTSGSMQITSIDGFFNRKRGRPPKNRFVEIYKNVSTT
ncbi:PREDICTED: uncharacterized protein LOC108358872 [Rhagoletis zephyria]|uniref:uncharacterized protein LOC108358872 n=1 Tax=Rhagoletis zephyria TaxID=28612 RepID=UPI00081167E0|nr:PREDICTED: uncharacterized protein LOC108358872 [Rhagoletis zephyria]